jgi:hypothetical protein
LGYIDNDKLMIGYDIDNDDDGIDDIDDDEDYSSIEYSDTDGDVENKHRMVENMFGNLYQDDLYSIYDIYPYKYMKDRLVECAMDFISAPDDTINMEAFNSMIQISYSMIKVAEAVEGRTVVHAVRKAKDATDRASTKISKITEPIENLISNTIDSVKKLDVNERRRRIVEGTLRFKLLKVIRQAIMLGVAFAIHPALFAVGLIATVALERNADNKVRKVILQELNVEVRMVKEKIDDAKSAGDNKKKYQLMRLESKLEKEIERIELRQGRTE